MNEHHFVPVEIDAERVPVEIRRSLWQQANTTPELIASSVGPGLSSRRVGDQMAVDDCADNHLCDVPLFRLASVDVGFLVGQLHALVVAAEDEETAAALAAAANIVATDPESVDAPPDSDSVTVAVAEPVPGAVTVHRCLAVPRSPPLERLGGP